MVEQSEENISVDIASRIEKTLKDREQERLNLLQEENEASRFEPSKKKISYFNILMLSLGIAVGVLVGSAFYFLMPTASLPSSEKLSHVEMAGELEEADRLLLAGQVTSAKKTYLSAISKGVSSPRPYNNLASLYAAEGDLEQAQSLLKKALETDPDYLTVYHNVGMIYAAMARDSYGKALQLQGETMPVRLATLGLKVADSLAAQKETLQVDPPAKAQPTLSVIVTEPPAAVTDKGTVPPLVAEAVIESAPVLVKPKVSPPAVDNSGALLISKSMVQGSEYPPVATELSPAEIPPAIIDPVELTPQSFMEQWALAWSSQDVEAYLKSYSADYTPQADLTHQSWMEKRRKRITAPSYIKVSLESVEIVENTEDSIKLEAIQVYKSDRYQDRTRKSFVLQSTDQTWMIVKEISLGRLR